MTTVGLQANVKLVSVSPYGGKMALDKQASSLDAHLVSSTERTH